MALFEKKKTYDIFIPVNGKFQGLAQEVNPNTIQAIAQHLGYNIDQIHMYHGVNNSKSVIEMVLVEIFSRNIVFILTKKRLGRLSNGKVRSFMKSFSYNDEFDGVNAKDILQKGIDNKSLNIIFLSKVLGIENPEPGGIYPIEKLGLYLYFFDGLLVDATVADGLEEWAKYLKNTSEPLLNRYINMAKKHHGNDISGISFEVNKQSAALFRLPNSVKNEFVPLHMTNENTINSVMLLVCHYDEQITMDEFKKINFGRFVQKNDGLELIKTFHLEKFEYIFSKDGDLLSHKLIE